MSYRELAVATVVLAIGLMVLASDDDGPSAPPVAVTTTMAP
jgi:hypothetical protein